MKNFDPETGKPLTEVPTTPMKAVPNAGNARDLLNALSEDSGATQPVPTVHMKASEKPALNYKGKKINLPSSE